MKKGHVLVIDPDQSTLQAVVNILKPKGYYVSSAGDARKGFSEALSEIPGLIVLNCHLPGNEDGMHLLGQLRSMAELNPVKIIMISSVAQPEIVARVIRMGANDFLLKPLQPDTFLERVQKWFPLTPIIR
jgi:DNA-binding response OmpR family regulator